MSLSYNQGAEIVPAWVLREILPGAYAAKPDNYERVQLLTEEAVKVLVDVAYDRSYIKYGACSRDFPLCEDFADVCRGDVKRESIKAGLAVRPAFGVLDYTKTTLVQVCLCPACKAKGNKEGDTVHARHAVNWAALVTRRVLFYEPQTGVWSEKPEDLKTFDVYRL